MKMQVTFKQLKIILFVVIVGLPLFACPQTDEDNCSVQFSLPEIALLDIEPTSTTNIELSLTTDPESGLPLTSNDAANQSLWINYTSSLPTGGNNRTVTVQVSGGSIPAGININLSSSAYSGSGQGTLGTPSGILILSTTPKTLITNIGRCFTGNGQNNGHRLNYSLSISDFQALRYNNSSTIQVVFTLTDN